MNSEIHSHKDLIVWRKSMDLVVLVYELSTHFPNEEKYGLISQMRRAVVSIPANIAEGYQRGTRKDYANFLRISYGSGAELETYMELLHRLPLGKNMDITASENLLKEILKMLNVMIQKLKLAPALAP